MLKYRQREKAYQKRLLIVSPVAVLVVALLFLTSDVVPYETIEKRFGWEGETQLLPEITILPDNQLLEDFLEQSRLQTMASLDVDPIKERADAEGGENERVESEREDPVEAPELDAAELQHFPQHAQVSYSEDYIITHMVQPEYPPRELIEGIEGDVTVELLINAEGRVENAWILLAVGPKSFERASLDAVRQFRFKPPTIDGQPVPMWIRFQIRFRLFG